MELEEAREKYKIDVPTDEIFYSKEYKDFFLGNKDAIDENLERYREFDEMYKKSFIATFGENAFNDPKYKGRLAVVLGGQTGAGKTGLVTLTNREALLSNKAYYIIDDDQFRKFYPRYDEIMAECPEYSTILTAIGSGPVTPKIMKFASDNGLNFIFDGTMKNSRICETAKGWKGYDVVYKVMATSRIESLLSIFERNAYLRISGFGRPVSVDAHDETYYGLPNTIRLLENPSNNANIEVYVRGESSGKMPELVYAPNQKGIYRSALEALENCREINKKQCLEGDINERVANLEASTLSAKEKETLGSLKSALRDEIKGFEI